MIEIPYFDDIKFIGADIIPECRATINTSFQDMFNLQYVHKGSIYLGVDGGKKVVLHAPFFFWHSPEHSYQYDPAENDHWHHFWVTFTGKRAEKIMRQGFMRIAPDTYIPIHSHFEFSTLFAELVGLVKSNESSAHIKAAAKLETLLAMLCDEKEKSADRPENGKLLTIIKKIKDSPVLHYDFRDIADGMNLSYSYFRFLFKNATGMPPHEFLLLSRMRKGAEMLLESRTPVKNIAAELGYNDPAQFCKLFKNKIGASPENYRNMHTRVTIL